MGNALEAVEKWVKSHPYLKDIAALNTVFEKMLENCDSLTEVLDMFSI